jgi:hypothetical protein
MQSKISSAVKDPKKKYFSLKESSDYTFENVIASFKECIQNRKDFGDFMSKLVNDGKHKLKMIPLKVRAVLSFFTFIAFHGSDAGGM